MNELDRFSPDEMDGFSKNRVDETINIDITIEDDTPSLIWNVYRKIVVRRRREFLSISFLCLLFFVLFIAWDTFHTINTSFGLLLRFLFLFMLFYGALLPLLPLLATYRRARVSLDLLRKECVVKVGKVSLHANGIHLSSDYMNLFISWDRVKSYISGDKVFVLYIQQLHELNFLTTLPNSGFFLGIPKKENANEVSDYLKKFVNSISVKDWEP